MSTLDGKLSSRLSEERKRLGYSQDAAGTVCGVSRKMWGNYESGNNMPGAEVLAAFMSAGADITYILGGTRAGDEMNCQQDIATYNRGDIDLIVDAYAHADNDGRAALLAVAKILKR